MLSLKQIVKNYMVGDAAVKALKGVNLDFRTHEFVSVLGPSGCGKTTLLNIIGGLDQYTEGDLIISGRSTKEFRSSDWDTYRNHSVGFVFQNYNLIPHQTVLSNVELALTLSGVSKAERRQRAADALRRVGLGDQLNKKPNQMSGGQMQRVAIARALVNDPDILLADEPTGALDSETSVQVMEILREISADKLIIMVTHNPELAERYSTRIIRLLDGKVVDDSNPYTAEAPKPAPGKGKRTRETRRPSMSFFTALSLSLNNLMTKKTRTLLTSFAGSIGIIGIALILAISSGVQAYIQRVEEDTLSSYPIMIEENTIDVGSLLVSMMSMGADDEISHDRDKVYSNDVMSEMINTMLNEMSTNNLEAFKTFLESGESDIRSLVSDIRYGYSTQMNIYKSDTTGGIIQVNPSQVFARLGMTEMMGGGGMPSPSAAPMGMANTNVWEELTGNRSLLESQYDKVAGRMPESYDEVIVIVDKNNEISDYTLYALGLKDPAELEAMLQAIRNGETFETEETTYTYDEILGQTYRLLLNTDYYTEQNGVWVDMREDPIYMKSAIAQALEVKVVGIFRPAADAVTTAVSGSVGYTSDLMKHLISRVNESAIVKAQQATPETDIFTGQPFKTAADEFDVSKLPEEEQAYLASLPEDERAAVLAQYAAADASGSSYEGNLRLLGVSDLARPSSINIYPKDFAAKEDISRMIQDYNDHHGEEYTIQYTDYIGLMMSSVTTIINAISYILIAFVAISLVVSSIMIGIITYISVLERTKEIGILRSIGASKRDISRVFNAETLIEGFASGMIGIGVTLLLIIPINLIINGLTGIGHIVALPVAGAVILVCISMLLTFIAGLIPARLAAKKDPVVALRTE